MTTTPPRRPEPRPDYDWDAEQEVDFRRHWNAFASRWWLPVAGLVVGAIIGYAISLGGAQTYTARATVYLGQPYSASGNVQLQSAQTNPSTVRTIATAASTTGQAAKACKLKPAAVRRNISVTAVPGSIARNGQTPNVAITLQGPQGRRLACAANHIAAAVVTDPAVAGFANAKIRNFRSQISRDEKTIAQINRALDSGSLSSTDQLLLQLRLQSNQQDQISATQLLQQANIVEAPRVLTHAASQKVTARGRRSSIVVAAIVGLLIGIAAALLWEPVASRSGRRPAA